MSDLIEITWTTASMDEARRVSRYLVKEKLVACAQITPWIESIYLWNGELETQQETKVAFKAKQENFQQIQDIILKNTSYEVPEITIRSIDGGFKAYMDWVAKT